MVCELLPRDRKCAQCFASLSQEIANVRDVLRACPRRSQMCAMFCELVPGDRKCARCFASLSQEIANVRDVLRACPKRSQMRAMFCELVSGDRKCARCFASLSQEIEIHPVHFLRRFCGRNSSQTFQGERSFSSIFS